MDWLGEFSHGPVWHRGEYASANEVVCTVIKEDTHLGIVLK
jgi:hypothetical protein